VVLLELPELPAPDPDTALPELLPDPAPEPEPDPEPEPPGELLLLQPLMISAIPNETTSFFMAFPTTVNDGSRFFDRALATVKGLDEQPDGFHHEAAVRG
jgi:hypothetical protein